VYCRGGRISFTELPEAMPKTSPPIAPAARVIRVRKAKKDHLGIPTSTSKQEKRGHHNHKQHKRGTFLSN
jgi:hypothetical protein